MKCGWNMRRLGEGGSHTKGGGASASPVLFHKQDTEGNAVRNCRPCLDSGCGVHGEPLPVIPNPKSTKTQSQGSASPLERMQLSTLLKWKYTTQGTSVVLYPVDEDTHWQSRLGLSCRRVSTTSARESHLLEREALPGPLRSAWTASTAHYCKSFLKDPLKGFVRFTNI